MRKMAENEVVFRRYNEQVNITLKKLSILAEEHSQEAYITPNDEPLHFYCECADENCKARIKLKPSVYEQIHNHRDQFIIVPGHQAVQIERVIKTTKSYSVVRKFEVPSSATTLNVTDFTS